MARHGGDGHRPPLQFRHQRRLQLAAREQPATQADENPFQQLEDRSGFQPRVQRQPGVAEMLIEIAAKIPRRLGQAQRQGGHRLQRQRRVAHQLREVLRMKYQLDAGFHQRLRLEMQFFQGRQLEKADADIYGVRRQRLQQLIGAQHRQPIIKMGITLADRLEHFRHRDAALRHHAEAQRAVQAMLERLHFQLQPLVNRDDLARPRQHPFALGGKAAEMVAAVNQRNAQFFFQIFQSHG
ncbi:Uncharacterised protein [Acinetobacter baumannii]|nr:Uncharacterised protein [Acinetobacter baumannii]